MANRKLPFGYCLQSGQVRKEEQEAETVRLIFRRYAEGASYEKLANELNGLGCPYAPGRPWNKNMVARILRDRRYLGSQEHPQIITPDAFHYTQTARPDVTGTVEFPEIKHIRVLAQCARCQEPMRRVRKNYWHCPSCMVRPSKIEDESLILCVEHLLRRLQEHPEFISPAPTAERENEAVQALQESL